MPFAVNDNGTWRYPKAMSVNDGGTWRLAKRWSINDNNTWRYGLYIGTLGVAKHASADAWGQWLAAGFGTVSPTADCNGCPILGIYFISGDDTYFVLNDTVGGGITQVNYLKSITVNGVTVTTASAGAFSSPGTECTWRWNGAGDLFGLQALNGSSVSLQLTLA
jgi:hypothetical protein